MEHKIIPIFLGFPAKSTRGFLGWSTALLIKITTDKNEQKNYLFDTGGYNERLRLMEKLQEHNVNQDDIDGIIISHLHFDHAVNWMLFPNASIYIHRFELYPNTVFEDFAVPEFHREKLLNHLNLQFVAEGDEMDGMKVIELPGHTEGLIGLQIGEKLLVSDAIKNRNELSGGELMNTWNEEIARKSITKILGQAKLIYPGHDIPLLKENNKWKGMEEAKELIIFANGLLNENNKSLIKIRIKNI
ncbi:MBL fold metallo-hydrolase [Oceanobacillus caeni]|uniref:MBL fold metallo-hydrolase n=1 Tax=Oceanobacillus caeni TaxID=405946 RepID=UPI00195CFC69